MGRESYRALFRKTNGYGAQPYKTMNRMPCKVCGQAMDAYHDAPKCAEAWLKQVDAKAKEGPKR